MKRNDGGALPKASPGVSETQSLEQRDGAEAQGQEAGAQQVAQRRQVGDGEVVWVQAPPPHQTDDEVGDVEEDGHLEGRRSAGVNGLPVCVLPCSHQQLRRPVIV